MGKQEEEEEKQHMLFLLSARAEGKKLLAKGGKREMDGLEKEERK